MGGNRRNRPSGRSASSAGTARSALIERVDENPKKKAASTDAPQIGMVGRLWNSVRSFWGAMLGSLATLCLLARIVYGAWVGYFSPVITIHPFKVFDEKSARFTGDSAANELSGAFLELKRDAQRPLETGTIERQLQDDDGPLQFLSVDFPAWPEMTVGPDTEDSVSQARKLFRKETELVGDVESSPDGHLVFGVSQHNVNTWHSSEMFAPGSDGLKSAVRILAEDIMKDKNPGMLAAALANEGRADDANEVLRRNADPRLSVERAKILIAAGRFTDALSAIDEAITSTEEDVKYPAIAVAATAKIDLGKYEEAAAMLRESFPSRFSQLASSARGRLLWLTGDKTGAVKEFESAACIRNFASGVVSWFRTSCEANPIYLYNLAWAQKMQLAHESTGAAANTCKLALTKFHHDGKLLLLCSRVEKSESPANALRYLNEAKDQGDDLVRRIAVREILKPQDISDENTLKIPSLNLDQQIIRSPDGNDPKGALVR